MFRPDAVIGIPPGESGTREPFIGALFRASSKSPACAVVKNSTKPLQTPLASSGALTQSCPDSATAFISGVAPGSSRTFTFVPPFSNAFIRPESSAYTALKRSSLKLEAASHGCSVYIFPRFASRSTALGRQVTDRVVQPTNARAVIVEFLMRHGEPGGTKGPLRGRGSSSRARIPANTTPTTPPPLPSEALSEFRGTFPGRVPRQRCSPP